ncbi:MAG: PAS domain S-box protein, partial [Roseiarcus sp.]
MHKDRSAAAKPRVRAVAALASEPTARPRGGATREFEKEKLLKENSKRYLAIVDTATDAIVVVNRFGQVQSFNRAAEGIFGYSAAEVIGADVGLLIPEAEQAGRDGVFSAFHRVGERKTSGPVREVEGRRKDGSTAPLELSIAEWRDIDGRPCFTGIMRDVTLRNTQARELQEAIEVAQQARVEAESA